MPGGLPWGRGCGKQGAPPCHGSETAARTGGTDKVMSVRDPRPHDPMRPAAAPAAAPAIPGREVELKLLVAAADLERIAALPLLADMRVGDTLRLRQVTTYYDTPTLDLVRRGFALRLRRQGSTRVQTVKTLGGGDGDAAAVAVRREWDWPVSGDTPDLTLLTGGELAIPPEMAARLGAVFTTDVQRGVMRLRPDLVTEIELALDRGTATATPPGGGSAHQPISEIELELVAGRVADLFRLAAEIHRRVPLRLTTRSKADAGFALLTGKRPAASPAKPLGVSPVTTVAEAFRHIGRNALSQLLDNETALLAGGDPEALREMAAALRRLDAGYSLFKDLIESPRGAGLRVELKRLGRVLEQARAWDRLALRTLAGGDSLPRRLDVLVTAQRQATRDAALALLAGPRWTGFLLDFAAWLEEGDWCRPDGGGPGLFDRTMGESAAALLAHRLRRLTKAMLRLQREGTAETWPRLWKRGQRLRYALDFCRAVMPAERVRPLMAAVEALRTVLKRVADSQEAADLLGTVAEDAEMQRAAKPALARLARARDRALADLPEAWRGVEQAAGGWA